MADADSRDAGFPSMAEIATLSDADLRLLAQQLGVRDEQVDRVTEAVRRATSRLVGANLPSEALVKAVRDATQRAIRREMQRATREMIRERQLAAAEGDTLLRWVSVQDDRVCEDCEARHGHVQTLADWEADGLPGSENTICDGRCRCELVEDDAFTGPYERGDVQVSVSLEVT